MSTTAMKIALKKRFFKLVQEPAAEGKIREPY